jgi:predicted thioredoxin/glutaredoxin
LILPTAVGGTSIKQWIQNATFRNVTLFSNFKEKVIIGKSHGVIKGILWHQGENDALNKETIDIYDKQLQTLFSMFRNEIGNNRLPIIIGELGTFSDNDDGWQKINEKIKVYIKTDSNAHLISTSDLKDKGDKIHFDSESQRKLGKRFAEEFNQIRN